MTGTALSGHPATLPEQPVDLRDSRTPPAESSGLATLQDLVRDCAASGVERRVLLLRTDLLPPRLTRPHHVRLMRGTLDPLLTAERARLYELPKGRFAVSWRGQAPGLLQQSLGALEHLLGDGFHIGPAAMQNLVRIYELPRQGAELSLAAGFDNDAKVPPPRGPAGPAAPPPLVPLDAAALAAMERQLAAADMARFARRKPIYRFDGGRVLLAWEKRYLSVSELTETLAPGRSVQADAWLFRRLTRVLDRRMLALLSAPHELRGAGPFSLDLNVGSLLSPEFLRFDSVLPGALRGRIVLDLQPADVLADPAAFAFARGFARARGYRLLLRGLTATLLPLLCLPRMELDFVQLCWSPGLSRLTPAMLEAGPAEWMLSHADDADAVQWGRDQGFTLFQGHALAVTA